MYSICLNPYISQKLFLYCHLDKNLWLNFFANILDKKVEDIHLPLFLFEIKASIYKKKLPKNITIQIVNQIDYLESRLIVEILHTSLYLK